MLAAFIEETREHGGKILKGRHAVAPLQHRREPALALRRQHQQRFGSADVAGKYHRHTGSAKPGPGSRSPANIGRVIRKFMPPRNP